MQVRVPLELVLSGRDVTEPRLSPDGMHVAFVQRWGNAAAISIVDVTGRGAERLVTFGPEPASGRGFGGGCYTWMPSSSALVYTARDGELWLVDGIDVRRVTHHERECRAPAVEAGGAFVVYVVDELEIWLTELATGRSRRLDDGRHDFCFDPAVSPDGATVSWQGWSPPAMPWDSAERVDARISDPFGEAEISSSRPHGGAVQQPRFAPDGTPTCVHDGSGWLNVYRGEIAVVAEQAEHAGPTWSMGQRSYAIDEAGSCFIARNESGYGSLVRIGQRAAFTRVAVEFTGVYGQLSVAGDRLCALRSGPTTAAEIVVVDLATAEDPAAVSVLVTGGVVSWSDVDVPIPEPVQIDDNGVTLHARRYRAVGHRRGMICWVHGGPTDQWQVDFRPRLAYWCSRGWDVLVVDPRGSTGHGRAYQQALNGGWGRIDVDDTAALVRHAQLDDGVAPESTVMIGSSSGGLTVLGVLADHPELVAGGVVSSPVSDIAALSEATHRFEAHYTDTLVGSSERFDALSPLHRAERIAGPLLLFHGSEDPVVPIAQSTALVDRIRVGGGAVDFIVYEGEGHGFRERANVADEYARTERFLDAISAALPGAISEPDFGPLAGPGSV